MSDERTSVPFPTPQGIEIELVEETRATPLRDPIWRLLEVWTQNSLYAIDSTMRCFDVIDRSTLRPLSDHPLLGAKLVGGQLQTEAGTELAYPFPLPGMEAVFERVPRGGAASFSYSSAVKRVVLRLRRVQIEGATAQLWGQLTGTLSSGAPSPTATAVPPPDPATPLAPPLSALVADPDHFGQELPLSRWTFQGLCGHRNSPSSVQTVQLLGGFLPS
ncbi:MAG: hypothetical protein RMJ98_06885 [Myxococcales bacterium]|nr:hypothetical protein [Polyangiaceae bacterium]MDW8249011.1 hypothetical protein [Myxococcales bacterium]